MKRFVEHLVIKSTISNGGVVFFFSLFKKMKSRRRNKDKDTKITKPHTTNHLQTR